MPYVKNWFHISPNHSHPISREGEKKKNLPSPGARIRTLERKPPGEDFTRWSPGARRHRPRVEPHLVTRLPVGFPRLFFGASERRRWLVAPPREALVCLLLLLHLLPPLSPPQGQAGLGQLRGGRPQRRSPWHVLNCPLRLLTSAVSFSRTRLSYLQPLPPANSSYGRTRRLSPDSSAPGGTIGGCLDVSGRPFASCPTTGERAFARTQSCWGWYLSAHGPRTSVPSKWGSAHVCICCHFGKSAEAVAPKIYAVSRPPTGVLWIYTAMIPISREVGTVRVIVQVMCRLSH